MVCCRKTLHSLFSYQNPCQNQTAPKHILVWKISLYWTIQQVILYTLTPILAFIWVYILRLDWSSCHNKSTLLCWFLLSSQKNCLLKRSQRSSLLNSMLMFGWLRGFEGLHNCADAGIWIIVICIAYFAAKHKNGSNSKN